MKIRLKSSEREGSNKQRQSLTTTKVNIQQISTHLSALSSSMYGFISERDLS